MPVNPMNVHNSTVIAEELNVVATGTMTKATFESGKLCRQRRRSAREKKMAFEIMAYRPVYTPLWCGPCFRQRHDTILAVHRLYVGELYAQAECGGWSNRSIEQAIRRCYQQEDKEIECFLAAVEEAESHNARLHSARRKAHHGNSDEDEYESDSEDNDDDVDESDNETEGGSTLNITSCGPRHYIELDDESSGSDSEGSPARMLLH
ncbi:hypothetical protein HO173_004489 [Letharia columbiana]|uniref:Uncharacterized protein n=1 Tax=Letharia columbiana TaxID=112416 RepID=A0A8H6FZ30_9LECA|nr:uncharacterized protein HO173_004489 [Letharia columbiana]KAF6237599.1 hypothetical protein HO173_004489 [Letharia columbiana]